MQGSSSHVILNTVSARWLCRDMQIFSALLALWEGNPLVIGAIYAGNPPVTLWFPSQSDLWKVFNKHSSCLSFEMPWHSCNMSLMTLLVLDSLWLSDATWWHGTVSTSAQVLACCLTAPSHYLNQCWTYHESGPLRITWGQCHKRYLSHHLLKSV